MTSEKEIVWDFVSPFYEFREDLGWSNHVFQAHRYGYDYPGLRGKRLDPAEFDFALQNNGPRDSTVTMQ